MEKLPDGGKRIHFNTLDILGLGILIFLLGSLYGKKANAGMEFTTDTESYAASEPEETVEENVLTAPTAPVVQAPAPRVLRRTFRKIEEVIEEVPLEAQQEAASPIMPNRFERRWENYKKERAYEASRVGFRDDGSRYLKRTHR